MSDPTTISNMMEEEKMTIEKLMILKCREDTELEHLGTLFGMAVSKRLKDSLDCYDRIGVNKDDYTDGRHTIKRIGIRELYVKKVHRRIVDYYMSEFATMKEPSKEEAIRILENIIKVIFDDYKRGLTGPHIEFFDSLWVGTWSFSWFVNQIYTEMEGVICNNQESEFESIMLLNTERFFRSDPTRKFFRYKHIKFM